MSQDIPEEKTESLLRDKSLKASVWDGSLASVMIGAGETYFNAFGIFLHATPVQIGTLATLPPLIGSLSQSFALWVMKQVKSRRFLLVLGATLQALIWLPLAWLALQGETTPHAVTYLIALVLVYHCLAGFLAPIWNSLIGEIVPPDTRGRYFGLRNRVCSILTFLGLVIAGQTLDMSQRLGKSTWGFAAIFVLAGVSRIWSARWLARHADPEQKTQAKHFFSFLEFVRRSPNSNFAKFVFFVATMNFAVWIGGPYFSVYMLRDLHLSYLQFTILSAATVVAQFLTMQRWGALTDRFGNKKILNVCAVAIGLNPLMWLFSSNFLFLILIQFFSGFMWAGFNLAASNFMFDAVSPPKRARCVAYQSIINGIFVLIGSLIGGQIATHVGSPIAFHAWFPVPDSPYLFLFLLSGIARFSAAGIFLAKFREVRDVERIRHRDLIFRITHIRPISGVTFGLVTGLRRKPRKAADKISKSST